MSVHSDPRRSSGNDARSEYYYRRSLTTRELLPAIGVGVGAGVVAFYLTKLFFERTPLLPTPASPAPSSSLRRAESSRIASRVDR
jgi:hypothetical protein